MKDMTKEQLKLRQFYMLNLLTNMNANYAAVKKADLDKNILKIDNYLRGEKKAPGLIDDWEIVWGPAVGNTEEERTYQPKKNKQGIKITRSVTDNAMYVAKKVIGKGQDSEYFIGISGTNGISLKGWFEQDFDVAKSVEWPRTDSNSNNSKSLIKPRVSKAAYCGFEALSKLTPGKGAKGSKEKKNVIDFILEATKNNKCSISIGGHSLGGCLTPLLAASIADRMGELDHNNLGNYKSVKINAYPTAGPTPGNEEFANHVKAKVNEYHAVYNSNDLVPLAWDFSGLVGLIKSYKSWKFGDKHISPGNRLVSNFIHGAKYFSHGQDYVREPSESKPNFHVTTWDNGPIKKAKKRSLITDEDSVKILANLMMDVSIKKELIKIYMYNFKGKTPTDKELKENAKSLARFLIEVLLQHVSAYSNPVSKGDIPWSFTEKEIASISKMFKRRITIHSYRSAQWSIATSVVLLARLSKKAAKALVDKAHPKSDFIEEEFTSEDMKFEGTDIELQNLEEELMSTFEKLLEDGAEEIDSLPFIGNPYS